MKQTTLLYQKIADSIKEKIEKGEFQVGKKIPTEKELSEEFGVSRITAKRALEELRQTGLIYRIKGSGSYVSEKTRAHTAENSTELRKKLVSLVIPFAVSSGGMLQTVAGISDTLKQAGYLLDINCTSDARGTDREILRQLYEEKAPGIIYYPDSDEGVMDILNLFYLEHYPLVVIDKYFDRIPLETVVSDNRNGMYEAAQYLIRLGHRRIAFVSDVPMEHATSVWDRYAGYAQALKDSGITLNPDDVANGTMQKHDIEQTGEQLRRMIDAGVTAFCAVNDYMAAYLIRCMEKIGVSVPQDVSVTGFDGLEPGEMPGPVLTTVCQDRYRIGKKAAEKLLDFLERGRGSGKKTVVPVRFREGNTCAVCKHTKKDDVTNAAAVETSEEEKNCVTNAKINGKAAFAEDAERDKERLIRAEDAETNKGEEYADGKTNRENAFKAAKI